MRETGVNNHDLRWLPAARAGWIILMFLMLGMMAVSFPIEHRALSTACQECASSALSPSIQRELTQQGISLEAYALIRHRLWDIDVVIRKTLVYAILTVGIGLAFFGTVMILQGLFQAVTGQVNSDIGNVISTLVIVALFTPLRRRIQQEIDRRFYRQKYNAGRSLERFSEVVRSDVELGTLSGSLAAVVAAAIQPQSLSLWIRSVPQSGVESARAVVGDSDTIWIRPSGTASPHLVGQIPGKKEVSHES